jgi:hypothetical protein
MTNEPLKNVNAKKSHSDESSHKDHLIHILEVYQHKLEDPGHQAEGTSLRSLNPEKESE